MKRVAIYIDEDDNNYIKKISKLHGDWSEFIRTAIKKAVLEHRRANAGTDNKRG